MLLLPPGEVLLGDLARAGFEITAEQEDADAIIINTCAFVEDAKAESLEVWAVNGHPEAVAVLGCGGRGHPEAVAVLGCGGRGHPKRARSWMPPPTPLPQA